MSSPIIAAVCDVLVKLGKDASMDACGTAGPQLLAGVGGGTAPDHPGCRGLMQSPPGAAEWHAQ